jgi:hypothetical protein
LFDEAVEQASENYKLSKTNTINDLLETDVEQLGSQINKALAKANVIQNITNYFQ